jgi:glycosyltransferase involved in cell wall biosynthesis
MLRVAYDVTVSSRAATGVGVYARELRASLAGRSLTVHDWQYPLRAAGSKARLINGARLAAWFTTGAARRAHRERIDVYHATTSLGPVRLPRPVVMTVHDATGVTMPILADRATRLFFRLFSVAAARRADAVLVPTRASADDLVSSYGVPRERVRIVPLGVHSRFRRVDADAVRRLRQRIDVPFPYVLYVGADTRRKNLHRLVQAFARVAGAWRDLHLVLAGPRALRDATLDERIAASAVRDRVHRREVAADDLPALYAGAACVAYVSLCEGFGLPLVEAMAAGAPIVTSNCSAMPEVAGGAGVLVEPRDVDAIAAGLTRILADSALAARLRACGRARSEAFTWDAAAAATEAVYRELS